jgi:hypothetical protein
LIDPQTAQVIKALQAAQAAKQTLAPQFPAPPGPQQIPAATPTQPVGVQAPSTKPNPYAMENQIAMLRRLGSPIYAQSPLRQPWSSAQPMSDQYNQQVQAAFAPSQQQQPPPQQQAGAQ